MLTLPPNVPPRNGVQSQSDEALAGANVETASAITPAMDSLRKDMSVTCLSCGTGATRTGTIPARRPQHSEIEQAVCPRDQAESDRVRRWLMRETDEQLMEVCEPAQLEPARRKGPIEIYSS